MLSVHAETTYGSVEIARLIRKKKKDKDEKPGRFDKFQFGTSAMVASDFDDLGGCRTLEYKACIPIKPYNCRFSRVFQASVRIATYGMSVPSIHTESTDSDLNCSMSCITALWQENRPVHKSQTAAAEWHKHQHISWNLHNQLHWCMLAMLLYRSGKSCWVHIRSILWKPHQLLNRHWS